MRVDCCFFGGKMIGSVMVEGSFLSCFNLARVLAKTSITTCETKSPSAELPSIEDLKERFTLFFFLFTSIKGVVYRQDN